MKRTGVGALILYMSAQAAASFAPEAAANEARAPAAEAPRAQRVQRLVLADPTWDAFVFASTATALALELTVVSPDTPALDSSWAFLAPEPQFDYLAALADVGMIRAPDETQPTEQGWLG